MFQQPSTPMFQQPSTPMFQQPSAASSSATSQPKAENGPANDDVGEKICDEESQRGHFGWETFGETFYKTYVPFILRQDEKYCTTRIVEMELLKKYIGCLPQNVHSCIHLLESDYITDAESRLFNEINQQHSDLQFGRQPFTMRDTVVRLSDLQKFLKFLDVCMSGDPSEKCGFIQINNASIVPYTVRDDQKLMPMFYFESASENLKSKADVVSGWDLAYLKFCCTAHGIQKSYFDGDSVAVISLADIKNYFPDGSVFEEYWPQFMVNKLLSDSAEKATFLQWTQRPNRPPPILPQQQHPTMNMAPAYSGGQANRFNVQQPRSSFNAHGSIPQQPGQALATQLGHVQPQQQQAQPSNPDPQLSELEKQMECWQSYLDIVSDSRHGSHRPQQLLSSDRSNQNSTLSNSIAGFSRRQQQAMPHQQQRYVPNTSTSNFPIRNQRATRPHSPYNENNRHKTSSNNLAGRATRQCPPAKRRNY